MASQLVETLFSGADVLDQSGTEKSRVGLCMQNLQDQPDELHSFHQFPNHKQQLEL
jgi:hypothetical protein